MKYQVWEAMGDTGDGCHLISDTIDNPDGTFETIEEAKAWALKYAKNHKKNTYRTDKWDDLNRLRLSDKYHFLSIETYRA